MGTVTEYFRLDREIGHWLLGEYDIYVSYAKAEIDRIYEEFLPESKVRGLMPGTCFHVAMLIDFDMGIPGFARWVKQARCEKGYVVEPSFRTKRGKQLAARLLDFYKTFSSKDFGEFVVNRTSRYQSGHLFECKLVGGRVYIRLDHQGSLAFHFDFENSLEPISQDEYLGVMERVA